MKLLLLLFSLNIFFSCGRHEKNNTQIELKQKELELKERTLQLKEKESGFHYSQNEQAISKQVLIEPVTLDKEFIWNLLYPNESNFNNLGQLIQNRPQGTTKEEPFDITKTHISKIFYYNIENKKKAIIILFTHVYDAEGRELIGHTDAAEVGVATFENLNNKWVKLSFIQKWELPQSGYGIESKFILTTYKNKLCLRQSFSDAKYKYYYNVETLQEIT